jgi:hypothetical protein
MVLWYIVNDYTTQTKGLLKLDLDAINKKILTSYVASKAPTLKDQMKQSKNAYGGPKYADLQDDFLPEMMKHYGVTDVAEDTAVAQRMGAEQVGGSLSSNTNVQSMRPDDLLTKEEMDELDILRK